MLDLPSKTEILIVGLTTSSEIIQIEKTDSRKYTKKSIARPVIGFTVCLVCIFQYGRFSFVISLKIEYVTMK